MSDCPGQVEIQFAHVNLWHDLSVGQALFQLEKNGNNWKLSSNYSRITSVTTQIIPKQKIQVDNGSVTRKKYKKLLLGFLSKQPRRVKILNVSKEINESRDAEYFVHG